MDEQTNSLTSAQGDSVKEMEAAVEEQRKRFVNAVGLLRERVEEISDWRTWVSRMPWTAVAGCAVMGWAVGRLTSGRR